MACVAGGSTFPVTIFSDAASTTVSTMVVPAAAVPANTDLASVSGQCCRSVRFGSAVSRSQPVETAQTMEVTVVPGVGKLGSLRRPCPCHTGHFPLPALAVSCEVHRCDWSRASFEGVFY